MLNCEALDISRYAPLNVRLATYGYLSLPPISQKLWIFVE